MVTWPVQASALVACCFLIASASPSSAQSTYLAPVPASPGVACGDTAPDCAAICKDSAGACRSRTPIGDYLRCTCNFTLPQCAVCCRSADLIMLCRANCKSTCGLCDSQSEAMSTSTTAGVPSLSPRMQPPSAYGRRSGTLSPSLCTFSCVDIPPPGSPITCAEQVQIVQIVELTASAILQKY